jgi:uncharacterized protein
MTDPVPPPKRSRKRRVLIGISVAVALVALYSFVIEPHWIEVTHHDVGTGARETVVLHLTDLHFSEPGRRERRVLEILAETKPDLIVITGDSIVRGYNQAAFTEFLSKLQAPLGVYACRGNWEDWVGPPVLDCYRRGGVRVLDEETAAVGDMDLVGLSTARSPVPRPTDRFRIALCHYPIILPPAARQRVDLVFAGHTHGGQVRLPFIGAPALPFDSRPYEAGWYTERGTRMYVSRGVGTSIFGFRFLCRPEVAVHRVRRS